MSPRSLLETALAFYRQPARFPDLRDPAVPLRGNHEPLLRLANGMAVEIDIPVQAEEMRAAARFYIEQVLLAPGADYYRMHGLTSAANDERVRENYRLLMRLLHPDRVNFDHDWQAAAALRVNQANATLRDPDLRRRYDESRAAACLPGGHQAVAPRPAPRVRVPLPQRVGDTPLRRFIWRNLPQISLTGIMLLASSAVAWIWLNESRSGALGGSAEEGTVLVMAPPVVFRPEAPAAGVVRPTPLATPAVLPIPAAPTERSPTLAAPQRVAALAVATKAAVPAETSQVGRMPAQAAHASEPALRLAGVEASAKAAVAVAAQPVPRMAALPPRPAERVPAGAPPQPESGVAAPPEAPRAANVQAETAARPAADAVPATKVALLTFPDPTTLASQFSQRYELGDIAAFMALFSANARENSGGWRQIKEDYEDLFNTTSRREILLSGMVWSPAGAGWRGEGQFRARIQRNGESVQRLYVGTLRMDLSVDDGKAKINGLYHKLAGQGVE